MFCHVSSFFNLCLEQGAPTIRSVRAQHRLQALYTRSTPETHQERLTTSAKHWQGLHWQTCTPGHARIVAIERASPEVEALRLHAAMLSTQRSERRLTWRRHNARRWGDGTRQLKHELPLEVRIRR